MDLALFVRVLIMHFKEDNAKLLDACNIMEQPVLNAINLLDSPSLIIDARLLIASILVLGDAPVAQQASQLELGDVKVPMKKYA